MRTAGTQRARDGILLGAGAGLALIVLLVLQSIIGSGLLSTRTATTTTTVTELLPAEEYSQVASAYANHLFALSTRNVSSLLSGYESNATVEWTGDADGLTGTYTGVGDGPGEIGRVLEQFPGNMVNLTLSEESQPTVGVQGGHLVAGSTFDWDGFNLRDGNISGIVAAQDSYAYVGNTWLIARETWNWIGFVCQFPGCQGV
jgi:hypothetical protein